MATIAVTPAALRERSGRVDGSAEAAAAAYRALTAVVLAEPAAGDSLLAVALTDFVQAWARVLPLLSESARLHGAALRAAADEYVDTDRRAADARD
jgi:uncharacterized protein YukE